MYQVLPYIHRILKKTDTLHVENIVNLNIPFMYEIKKTYLFYIYSMSFTKCYTKRVIGMSENLIRISEVNYIMLRNTYNQNVYNKYTNIQIYKI